MISRDFAGEMASFVAIKPSRLTEAYGHGQGKSTLRTLQWAYVFCEKVPPCIGGAKTKHAAGPKASLKRRRYRDSGELSSGCFGDFYGCSNFPNCNGTTTPRKFRAKERRTAAESYSLDL